MGWQSQAARRPRMPSPDYFSVVPTLMDPTLTSKYFMDLSIRLYLKIQNIFYMYWSVLFWHCRYLVNICNSVNCYTMIATKCTYYRQITCVVGIILCILVPKSNQISWPLRKTWYQFLKYLFKSSNHTTNQSLCNT